MDATIRGESLCIIIRLFITGSMRISLTVKEIRVHLSTNYEENIPSNIFAINVKVICEYMKIIINQMRYSIVLINVRT